MAAAASWPHIDDMALPETLIDLKLICLESVSAITRVGGEVLARFPDAELVIHVVGSPAESCHSFKAIFLTRVVSDATTKSFVSTL